MIVLNDADYDKRGKEVRKGSRCGVGGEHGSCGGFRFNRIYPPARAGSRDIIIFYENKSILISYVDEEPTSRCCRL